MDVAASAVGIASFGIQVCQGLLDYYDGWKGYHTDVTSAYTSIADLSRTLALLKVSLSTGELDRERVERVRGCLSSSEDGLMKLSTKLQKLRTHITPDGTRQKVWSEIQRAWYPFRASTLAKLRETVDDVQERLRLAIQVLQLDLSINTKTVLGDVATNVRDTAARAATIENVAINSQKTLGVVAIDVKDTAARAAAIEAAVAKVAAQNQRMASMRQSDQWREITDWLSAPDPWTNHASARQRHEPQTGDWLFQSGHYLEWKAGTIRHLWLHGKAGCGKTILCSTAIEDMQAYCENAFNVGHAFFYFSFSDEHKQSYEDLLRSMAVQLAREGPGSSMLKKAYEKSNRTPPATDELESILLSMVASYDAVYLHLDALDECSEEADVRQNLLERLEKISGMASNLQILATSRELRDVHETMDILQATKLLIPPSAVHVDIQKFVSTEISRDRKLGRLDTATRSLVEKTISQKADGMFRWAYCQLQELKKLKSTKPRYVKDALRTLPPTLDATYERMLYGIEERYRTEALTLLRWLAYARSPLTLRELAEAAIIDPSGEGCVDVEERGDLEDTLDILAGLVVCTKSYQDRYEDSDGYSDDEFEALGDHSDSTDIDKQIWAYKTVRLAHFSVKEYLESDRIAQSEAEYVYLQAGEAHAFLAQSCLTYLMHYGSSREIPETEDYHVTFPLLDYAARSWYYHSSLQDRAVSPGVSREARFLRSAEAMRKWLFIHQPDSLFDLAYQLFWFEDSDIKSDLYYASAVGLENVVDELLSLGSDINAQDGCNSMALAAASYGGHDKIVEMLIARGADVNSPGSVDIYALLYASDNGHLRVVEILLEHGADVEVEGYSGRALHLASRSGHEEIVKVLLARGAKVNAEGGDYGYALQAASFRGNENLVQMLLDAGADVNASGGQEGCALHAASTQGYEKVVRILLNAGADIKAHGMDYGNGLNTASANGHEKVVQMLLNAGADVNAREGFHFSALKAASMYGHQTIVRMLLDAGADDYDNALEAALDQGHGKVVRMLLDAGARYTRRLTMPQQPLRLSVSLPAARAPDPEIWPWRHRSSSVGPPKITL